MSDRALDIAEAPFSSAARDRLAGPAATDKPDPLRHMAPRVGGAVQFGSCAYTEGPAPSPLLDYGPDQPSRLRPPPAQEEAHGAPGMPGQVLPRIGADGRLLDPASGLRRKG